MSRRPHLVYIDCHDLGDWLGCYGRPHLHTPNLDRLAAEGAIFTQYIATAPICMPSRAATYTGHMPHTTGVTGQFPLYPDEICLAERLRRVGYRTTLVGGLKILNDPQWAGFEQVVPVQKHERLGHAAADWIGQRTPNDDPFFVSISFDRVHRPFGSEYDSALAAYIDVPPYLPDLPLVHQDLATLHRQIEALDAEVGLILEALDDAGLTSTTVVIFTTEHGPALARAKHTLYDSGLKIALLLRYPPLIAPGSRHDDLISTVDLLPTLLEMVGEAVPGDLHGRSFLPLLTGATFSPRTAAYSEQSWGRRAGLHFYSPARSLRTAHYKYIRNFSETPSYVDTDWLARFGEDRQIPEERYGAPAPPEELYDLASDGDEQRNLADDPAYRATLIELRHRLVAFLDETSDPVLAGPVPNRSGHEDVPLWLRQPDGSFRLRAYHPEESGEHPFPQS